MIHHAAPDFWKYYHALSPSIRALADKAFSQLKSDPMHPSLHFKRAGKFWSARVGLHHRAVGVEVADGVLWFWIGRHADYDRIVG